MKKKWGCVTPSQNPVTEIEDDDKTRLEMYSCPTLFIPRSVKSWWAEYNWADQWKQPPKAYNKMPSKWVEAMQIYKHEYNAIEMRKMKG